MVFTCFHDFALVGICSNASHVLTLYRGSFRVEWMNSHPLVASAASGSISSLLLWLLRDLARNSESHIPIPIESVCPTCPICPDIDPNDLIFWKGVLFGILAWPFLEALLLFKQWLLLVIKNRLYRETGDKLYKVL